MSPNDKQAIIFDFGNVIAFFDYEKVVEGYAGLLKEPLSPDEVKQRLFANDLLAQLETGRVTEEDFIEEIKNRLDLHHISNQQLIDIWCDMFTPNEYIASIIHRIPHHIDIVLGSTTNPLHYNFYRQEYAKIFTRFKGFVTSFEVGVLKPDPLFYERCLQEAGHPPNQCTYIDDIPEYVAAAAKLGIEGIHYQPSADITATLYKYGIELTG